MTAAAAGPRVLFVSPVSDIRGGAEQVLLRMLATRGISPVLAVPEKGALSDAAAALGVPVCFFWPKALQNVHRPPRVQPILAATADVVRCAFRLRRLAAAHGCDIVHSNGLKTHVLNAVLARISRVCTVVHLHDIPYRPVERLIWYLIGLSVAHVVAVSPPCYPFTSSPRRRSILWNGLSPGAGTPPETEPGRRMRLGFVGRFHPHKGLGLLLDWYQAVRAAGIDASLAIRGRPDPTCPEHWDAIRQRIEREADPLIQMEGWRQGDAAYADLDVLLVPSHWPDPAPLVVLEAMVAGVVVIGYPAGGIPFMIEQGETGLLAATPAEAAAAIAMLTGDSFRAQTIRDTARRWVERERTSEQFEARLRSIYAQLRPVPRQVPAQSQAA